MSSFRKSADLPPAFYNTAELVRRLIYGLGLNYAQSATNIEVTNTNRHLIPIETTQQGNNFYTEVSASQVNASLILRYDLILDEDLWLKRLLAFFTLTINTPTTLVSVELKVTYTQADGKGARVIYDETLTTANMTGATNTGYFNMPSRSMYEYLAKGGLLHFDIFFNSTNAGAGTITVGIAIANGIKNWIELDVQGANTSKDTEINESRIAQ